MRPCSQPCARHPPLRPPACAPAGVSSGQGAVAEMTPGRRGASAGSIITGVSPVVNRSSSTPPLSTLSQQCDCVDGGGREGRECNV